MRYIRWRSNLSMRRRSMESYSFSLLGAGLSGAPGNHRACMQITCHTAIHPAARIRGDRLPHGELADIWISDVAELYSRPSPGQPCHVAAPPGLGGSAQVRYRI